MAVIQSITVLSQAEVHKKEQELHSEYRNLGVDFKRFYGFEPKNVDRRFVLSLSDHSYLPKIDNPRADWVVTAALNSFSAYHRAGLGVVKRFATVGTGAGTDVIAALETFPEISGLALTDLHSEVAEAAKRNVLAAVEKADERVRHAAMTAMARGGDVLQPLQSEKAFDVIYENLPNIPLPSAGDLGENQTSSTYVGNRSADKIPSFVSAALLDLHYVCLRQAKSYSLISGEGAILSSMGGRVSTEAMLNMADAAEFAGRIISYSWKDQSEPENVIGGYADWEAKGLGPFFFYPSIALEQVFEGLDPAAAAFRMSQIEEDLLAVRLNATEALKKHHEGTKIGHTVVVMASVLKRNTSRRIANGSN